jgi:hypothetical protein
MIVAHFKKRPDEAWLGGFTAGMGLWVLLPMSAMQSGGYAALLELQPEWMWGLMFLFVGLAHVTSVAVNGMCWWTPLARAATSLVIAVLYGSWVWGFWLVSPASTAVYFYSVMGLVSLHCLRAALFDIAQKIGAAKRA